ncbi:MAG TPA: periplasmic heavy metal sensor [Thermoanaerobaculia bacterium]
MKRFLAAALLALAAASMAAQADIPEGKWWKRPRIAKEIGLTDDQARRIEEIFVRERPKLIDLKAGLEKRQFELQTAMENNAPRPEVEKRLDAVENARKDLQKTRVLMLLDIKNELKPEQWERLRQMREDARERRSAKGGAQKGAFRMR